MASKVKNVLLKLMNVLSVLIIIASVMALLTVVMAKPGQAPNFFGYSLFRVMTGSMEPTIPTNSLIVVKRVPASELVTDDVITFYSRDPSLMGEPNTHRIIRIEEGEGGRTFTTKGDANNIEDKYQTKEEDLIGKVVYSSKGFGTLVRLISNPLIFIPLIVVPLVIMLIRNVYDGIKAAKQLAKEEEEAAVREALAQLREKKKAAQEAAKTQEEPQENTPDEAQETPKSQGENISQEKIQEEATKKDHETSQGD